MCHTRGVGAGRWVQGWFLPKKFDSTEVTQTSEMNLASAHSTCVHVSGAGATNFLRITWTRAVSDGHRKIFARLSSSAIRKLTWRFLNSKRMTSRDCTDFGS